MSLQYILNAAGEPERCHDLLVWAMWMEHADRVVAQDRLDDAMVSTVFLGLDHNFGFGGPPLLYETMVFGGKLDQEQNRYATRDEAERGHTAMLERVLVAMTGAES